MRNIIDKMLSVINMISFLSMIFWAIDGYVYEIFGPEIYKKLLSWLKVPWNYEQSLKIAYICLAIFIITCFIRAKLFRK